MREDGVNRIEAKTEKIVLDKKGVENGRIFVRLDNRRDIRKGQVNKLVKVLELGEHFETPLMTHKKNGKHRLLDGNHRDEAMKIYLDRYPKRKIEVWIFYYINLTDEEERKYYTKWNSGLKQSTNDFVQQYWDTIPIVKIMGKSFCWKINHCWTSNAIEFKALVGAYLTKEDKTFRGGFAGGAMEFIGKSQKLGSDDVKKMNQFLKEYINIFGNPDKKNVHYKHNIFYSVFRIWLDNLNRVSYTTMQNTFRRIRGCPVVISYADGGNNRDACMQCRNDLIRTINNNKKKNLFV